VSRASLAIVLHTHMPYVEGFGTWPFGEEWLWEAIATSYLPLLDVLDAHPGRVTVSLTPVLCDQLEAPGALARCLAFLRELRPESHRLDLVAARDPVVVAALEHSAARYAAAADALERRGSLLAAFAPHASWTSAATHPILPLLATGAGLRLQLRTGIDSHRARFGDWDGGFWLPECAHSPWLDAELEQAGVRVACVDWTDVLGPGPHAPRQTRAGVLLAPLDREAIDLVWHERGYPSRGAYLDTHRLTERHHRAWAISGAPYEPERALLQARADAEDFVERVAARGGPSVVALDTELLGHFWPEGVDWLRAVIEAWGRAGGPRAAARAAGRRARRAGARVAAGDDLGRGARPADLERSGGRRAGMGGAGGGAARPHGRRPAGPAGAARAAGAAGVRLGLPRGAPDRRPLSGRARGRASRGVRGRARRSRRGGHLAAPGARDLTTALKAPAGAADRFVRAVRIMPRFEEVHEPCRVSAVHRGGERGNRWSLVGSRGESPHECGVAQVFARARQLTP
jgi:1,4-alpha-glucan branching enzyme